MTHTISVIVPVYNAENYVSCCIESVLDQTYCNWQMILKTKVWRFEKTSII